MVPFGSLFKASRLLAVAFQGVVVLAVGLILLAGAPGAARLARAARLPRELLHVWTKVSQGYGTADLDTIFWFR